MSLTEKIRWRNRHPLGNSWFFADKIVAKEIAHQRAPECGIHRTIFTPLKPEEIDVRTLPENYVFKANHGSGWLIKVRGGRNLLTGERITSAYLVHQAGMWLSRIHARGHERQYVLITPRVFFEELSENFSELRFFCFAGRVKFIMVDMETPGGTRSTIYDTEWNRIHAHWRDPAGEDIVRPAKLAEFVRVVEKLAADIDFVRIDTYIREENICFGEFTFTPNAGGAEIHPSEFDMLWGSYWTDDMSGQLRLRIPSGVRNLNPGSKISASARIAARLLADRAGRLRIRDQA